jgi:hypothetical protein
MWHARTARHVHRTALQVADRDIAALAGLMLLILIDENEDCAKPEGGENV